MQDRVWQTTQQQQFSFGNLLCTQQVPIAAIAIAPSSLCLFFSVNRNARRRCGVSLRRTPRLVSEFDVIRLQLFVAFGVGDSELLSHVAVGVGVARRRWLELRLTVPLGVGICKQVSRAIGVGVARRRV